MISLFISIFIVGVILIAFLYLLDRRRGAHSLLKLRRIYELTSPSPYEKWVRSLKTIIPVYAGTFIKDIRNLKVSYWDEMGGGAAYLRLYHYQMTEAIIVEIPQEKSLTGHRHLYEERIFIIKGGGFTEFQQEQEEKQKIFWRTGSYFSVPLNVWHKHSSTADIPVRFLSITSAPLLMNIFGSREVLYSSAHIFKDRYNPHQNLMEINSDLDRDGCFKKAFLIEDVMKLDLKPDEYIGKNFRETELVMAGNILGRTHVSEAPRGSYIKIHKHGGEIYLYALRGRGYFLLQDEAMRKKIKIDFEEGTLVGIPPKWWQQVFFLSDPPARLLVFKEGMGYLYRDKSNRMVQISYKDQHPSIEKILDAELKKSEVF